MKQKHIYRLIFFFVMAFALGSLVGKIFSHFTSDPRSHPNSAENSQTSSASMTFQNENWGLGFQEEGKRPTGNASMEELKNYNAWYAADTDEKKIYLTFDAGYDNGNMPALLNALHKHQVHATFFVVGTLIREKPELIREIVDAGHTIGNHTMTHPDMSGISTKEAFQKQLEDVEVLYKEATAADESGLLHTHRKKDFVHFRNRLISQICNISSSKLLPNRERIQKDAVCIKYHGFYGKNHVFSPEK